MGRRTVARSNRVDQPLSELRIFAEKASDSLEETLYVLGRIRYLSKCPITQKTTPQ